MTSRHAIVLVAISALLSSASSFALVRELGSCTTSDGRYEVQITDNEGIGLVRASKPVATVIDRRDRDEIVASFSVHEETVKSVSFGGHPTYLDNRSNGEDFSLVGPSTNSHTVSLKVILPSGAVVSDDDLSCTILSGS